MPKAVVDSGQQQQQQSRHKSTKSQKESGWPGELPFWLRKWMNLLDERAQLNSKRTRRSYLFWTTLVTHAPAAVPAAAPDP